MRGLFGSNKTKSGQNPTPTQEQHERMMVKVGDLWWPIGMVSGRDIHYNKQEQPQTPPIPANARSFGNEAPPREMRKPPTTGGIDMKKPCEFQVNVPNDFAALYIHEITVAIRKINDYSNVEQTLHDDGVIVVRLISDVYEIDKIKESLKKGLGLVAHHCENHQ